MTLMYIMISIVQGTFECDTYMQMLHWIYDHYDKDEETVKPYIVALQDILHEYGVEA